MRLYSYVVARDYGFAPNPFNGFCTLATCKPEIRRTSQMGDWIMGTSSARTGHPGRLVYAMQVTETMSYDEYWTDERFKEKRPTLRGSKKQAYGDNIYHHNPRGEWLQANSHHSLPNGKANPENVAHDTRVDRVLISARFTYWGGEGPEVPARFRDFGGVDVCVGRQGHICNFPEKLVNELVAWLEDSGMRGYAGRPHKW